MVIRGAGIALVYILIGRLSMLPIIAQGPISTIWVPAGVALGALLIAGPRYWPGVAIGSFVVALSTGVPLPAAVLIGAGNALEAVLGAVMVTRIRGTAYTDGTGRVREALAIGFLGGVVAAAVSALLGVGAITAVGLEPPSQAWFLWRSWWLGDTLGVVLFTPLITTFRVARRETWSARRLGEGAALFAGLSVTAWLAFARPAPTEVSHIPVAFAVFPFLVWAVVRFGPFGASLASAVVSLFAVHGMAVGAGPFVANANAFGEPLLHLLPYLFVTTMSAQVLAAIVVERGEALERLGESEERLDGILSSLDDAVWSYDAKTDELLYVSAAAKKLYGRPIEALRASPTWWMDVSHPDDHARVLALAESMRRDGHGSLEYRIVRPDGSVRWVFDRGRVVHNAAGKPIRYDGMVTDITERKRAEQAVRQIAEGVSAATGDAFFRSLVLHLARTLEADCAFVGQLAPERDRVHTVAMCVNGEIVNNVEYELAGTPCEQALRGETCVFGSGVREQFPDAVLLTELGIDSYIGTPLVSASGVPFGVMAVLDGKPLDERPLAESMLRIFGVRASAELERRLAEEELQRSRQRLLLLFQQSPLGVIEWDLEMRVTGWNPAAERIFGIGAAEAIGLPASAVLGEVGAAGSTPVDARSALAAGTGGVGGGSSRRTRRHATRRGETITCEWYDTALVDANGAVIGAASLVEDISERTALEEQLRQAQKMEAVGKLAGGVAHDFNNLLTAITGYGALVLRGIGSDNPAREDVQAILSAADRAAALTRQLLAFSRKQVVSPRVLDLSGAVESIEPMLRRLIGEHIELVTRVANAPLRITADPSQIEQVILNLAVNARDAMPDGGRVTIHTAPLTLDSLGARRRGALPPGSYALLSVSDTGLGMDDATRARIFEPFFTTKALGRGTGLGLATVYGIVKASGGAIEVESAPGRGTTFRVLLPVAAAPPEEPFEPKVAPPTVVHEGATVLVVEDEEAVRHLVEKTLRGQGFRVLAARDGVHALEVAAAEANGIALLLTDVVMPRMGGKQLAERLTALRPDMRVLFMSGYTEDAVVRQAVRDAGVAFLSKPFTTDDLTSKVGEVLSSAPRAAVTGAPA